MWWTHNKHSCIIRFFSAEFNCTVHGHGKKFWTSEVKKNCAWKLNVRSTELHKSLQEQMFELLPWKFRTFANLRFQVWKYNIYWNAWPWFRKENYLLFDIWVCLPSVNSQLMSDISGNFTSPCKNYMFRNFKSGGTSMVQMLIQNGIQKLVYSAKTVN